MSAQQLSLLEPSNARARKHDPRTSKRAAALNPEGRASQAARILRYLWEFDRVTADRAHRLLTLDGEDVTRGEWSARIGVLMHRGLVEKADVMKRVIKGADPEDCWIWTGTHSGEGYGHMTVRSVTLLVHRITYELFVGSLEPGLVIDHVCRNRGCCNPAHLEQITQQENVRRGVGLTAVNAAKTHCKRGHEFTPENTKLTSSGHRACRECIRTKAWVA